MTVFLDFVFLLNFLIDFLLLLGTNRLTGFPLQPVRCAFAAALGSVYAAVCLIHGFLFLGEIHWRICVLLLIAVCAFGFDRSAVKRGGIFVLLSLALGGAAVSLNSKDFLALALAAWGIWLLCRIGFGSSGVGQEYVPISLRYGGNEISLVALRDSGNSLRDPITGERVFLIGSGAAEKLTGLSERQIQNPFATIAERPIPGLRLIPYHAVGTRNGMLLALRLDQVKIGGKVQSAVVAFSPGEIGNGEVYQALITV